jgi:hypothetical protein
MEHVDHTDLDQERLERLREGLSETAFLLYRLWRANSPRERAELGWEVAQAIERYGKSPPVLEEQGL